MIIIKKSDEVGEDEGEESMKEGVEGDDSEGGNGHVKVEAAIGSRDGGHHHKRHEMHQAHKQKKDVE